MEIEQIRRLKLKQLADELTVPVLAEKMGCNDSYVRQLTGGHRNISSKKARSIEHQTGKPPFWLEESDYNIIAEAPTVYITNTFTEIPLVDSFYHAGDGDGMEHKKDPEFLKSLSFRRDWLEYEELEPRSLKVAMVHGKSMEPLLQEADVILVDRRQNSLDRIQDGRIYAVTYHGNPLVKRLYKQETGGVKLVSEDKHYDPINIMPENIGALEIVGLVVWAGGKVM